MPKRNMCLYPIPSCVDGGSHSLSILIILHMNLESSEVLKAVNFLFMKGLYYIERFEVIMVV